MKIPVMSLFCLVMATVSSAAYADPLKSVMWDYVRDRELGVAEVVFDDRVRVDAPDAVEDGMNVPVSVRAEGIDAIDRIVVLADHNPIQRVLNFYPEQAVPFIAFRMKVQESTPIRAAVQTVDGTWLVGGKWIDAQGGGCTTASESQASRLWETSLNQVAARVWSTPEGGSRLRMRIIHPMDTGLVASIPAFYLEELYLQDADGGRLARLEVFEPVSENPVFTIEVPGTNSALKAVVKVSDDRFEPRPQPVAQ